MWINLLIAVLAGASVLLSALRAFKVGGRVDLGWLAVACFFAAAGLLPAATSV